MKDEIKKILTSLKGKKEISFDQLNDIIPDNIISSRDFERILSSLEKMGLKIIEEEVPRVRKKGVKESIDIKKLETPSKMYLEEVNTLPVLTREEETKAATLIETYYKRLTQLLLSTLLGVKYFLKYKTKIEKRKLPPEEFVRIAKTAPSFKTLENERKKILKVMERVRTKYYKFLVVREGKKGNAVKKYLRRNIRREIKKLNLQFSILDEIEEKVLKVYKEGEEKRKEEEKEGKKPTKRGSLSQDEKKVGMKWYNFEKLVQQIEDLKDKIATQKQVLVCSNVRLVISIAKKYFHKGMDYSDLIQEGNLGLMKAISKFDHRKGYRFSTYASWWIRQAISRAIAEQAKTIRVPLHAIDIIHRVLKETRTFVQEYGTIPTLDEIASRLEVSPRKIKRIYFLTQDITSLDHPIGDGNEAFFGDFIAAEHNSSPAYAISRAMLKEKLEEVLQDLSEKERKVLTLRFGLRGTEPKTLEEVGIIFDVTRERIRQIEQKALRKLRYKGRRKKLEPLLDLL